jgi:DNA (cytosine-5)-methyltransferase 1
MRYLSLFSGIEACTVAWHALGWHPVAFAEVDAFPSAVLAHHYPRVPNLGDATKITVEQIVALGPIDLVVGGSPCQDLSVAGKRAGLAGARSSLFHHQARIFDAARAHCGARWLLWENVPGAFSTHGGRDFARVVDAMAGCEIAVPADGWGNEGMALGPTGLVEWAVLDAQWFGVAQRRRRVFVVLDAGNWSDRPPVLLEPDSLRGHSAPRREAGEGIAPSLAARTRGGGGLGTDAELDGALIPATVGALCDGAHMGGGLTAKTHTADESFPRVAMCLNAGAMGRQDSESETLIPTIGGGFDAVAFDTRQSDVIQYGDKSGPLDTDGHTVGVMTLAIRGRGDSHDLEYRDDGTANAILTPNGGRAGIGVGAVAFDLAQITSAVNRSRVDPALPANTLNTTSRMGCATDMQVRRLTPRECERLQGFPDDYTLIPYRGKPAAGGPRYKALGNSMAVPVMRWIGRQIQRAHHYQHENSLKWPEMQACAEDGAMSCEQAIRAEAAKIGADA